MFTNLITYRNILVFFSFLVISCGKEEENPLETNPSIVVNGNPITLIRSINEGQSGGKTIYPTNTIATKSSSNTFFLSQFPLVEHRYKINIAYDSIPTYEIDSITSDTLNIQWEINEIDRDTTDFKEGKLWLPFDDRIETALYIATEAENIDSLDLRLRWELTDNHPSESGLLFRCVDETQKARDEGGYDNCFGGNDSEKQIDEYITWEKTQIPIFDGFGRTEGYAPGIRVPLNIRHFQVNDVTEITRTFRLTISKRTAMDSISISSDFELFFVPKQKYEERICWLAQEYECRDNFEE